jgi:hypothetical protein
MKSLQINEKYQPGGSARRSIGNISQGEVSVDLKEVLARHISRKCQPGLNAIISVRNVSQDD